MKIPSFIEQILNVLRDPAWQSVGIIIGVIGVIFTYKQLNKKSLSYCVISKSNILAVPTQFKDKLEIKYNQEIINSLYVVNLILKNTGNIAIKPDDFEGGCIKIRGGDNEKIMSCNVTETNPKRLKVNLALKDDEKGNYVSIERLLLNSKDSLQIQFLFEEFDKVLIEARIVDIKETREYDDNLVGDFIVDTIKNLVGGIFVLFIFIVFAFLLNYFAKQNIIFNFIANIVKVCIIICLPTYFMFVEYKSKRNKNNLK